MNIKNGLIAVAILVLFPASAEAVTVTSSGPGGVSVTATPQTPQGSTFTGWSGNCTGTGSCVLTGTQSAVANFITTPPAAPPPTATFTKSPTQSIQFQPTNFTWTGTCAAAPCTYRWRHTQTTFGTGPTATFTYQATGSKLVHLDVTDAQGRTVTGQMAFNAIAPPPATQRTLTVTPPSGTGTGTITGTGISCPGDCSQAYADGTAVTLTANPTGNSTFNGWSGDCTGTGSCNLTMNANKAVSGSFTAPPPPPAGECLLDPCNVVASDTASNPDPLPFWGAVDCANPTRYQTVSTGGDPQATANGTPQGNTAFRQTTVFDGDNFFGERCELGRNSWQNGPVAFYREGDHKVTYFSMRLPDNFPLHVFNWQGGMQLKQAQTSDGGGGVPILSFSAYDNRWLMHHSDPGPDSVDDELWSTPAQKNVWTRVALDVHFSQFASQGSIKIYIDVNGDGDWSDTGEQSPLFNIPTMKYEVGTDSSDGLVAGQTIPSHLRMGLYHDSVIPCPTPNGCSIQFDNIQVVE